jgi:ribokinase
MDAVTVLGFGAMNMDTLYRVHDILVDGEAPVEECQSLPGGSAANTVYALGKLGINAGFIGAVGDDEAGRALLSDFAAAGVDVSQIRVKKDVRTGSALGLVDHDGRRALYLVPGANSALQEEDISLSYVQRASVVHLSSFVDEGQLQLQKWFVDSAPASVRVSFAPGAMYARRGLSTLTPILARTHVLFANRSEVEELGGAEYRVAARHLLKAGCKIVVVTLGGAKASALAGQSQSPPDVDRPSTDAGITGANEPARFAGYIADADGEHMIEAKEANVRDTTGAGDAFAAGVLYGLLKEKSLRECGILGEIMARFCISEMGARAGLPALAALAHSFQETTGQPL